jgi:uncharacterized damage-inducible protein DinB
MPQQQTVSSNTPLTQPIASERERFIHFYERESATTRKVLGAYPGAECELRPHERSNTAKALARTFVIEQSMILMALRHDLQLGKGWPATPENWDDLLAAFDSGRAEILDLLRNSSDDIFDGTVTFFTGPKQTGEYQIADFVNFMTCDQIHHRGQMSVYLRLAGAKVPSIYGPSADEPWM